MLRRKYGRAIVAASVVAVSQSMVWGGASFSAGSSGAKWNFQPNTATTSQQKIVNLGTSVPSSGSMPVPSSYQLAQTFTNGAANSVARGSVGYLVNSTTATFTLAAGTGVTQTDPNHTDYPNYSRVRLDFDGTFDPTSPSFGPVALGYVSVSVGGAVAAGGSAKFAGSIAFLNGNTGAALRSTVSYDQTFTSNFAQTFTSSSVLGGGTIPVGTPVRVRGYFEFYANNDGAPVQITPTDIEFGNAPPTATWYAGVGGDWGAPGAWAPPANAIIDDPQSTLPAIPNGVGQRARFIDTFEGSAQMTLDVPITLGALDIDAHRSVTLAGAGAVGTLTMDVNAGNATIQVRNVHGSSEQFIQTNVVMNDSLDITTEGSYFGPGFDRSIAGLTISGVISGSHTLTKLGGGNLTLLTANTYTGGTNVAGGVLNAEAPGSLGTGSVTVDDGQLNFDAAGAAASGVVVQVHNGGQVHLGAVPTATDQFNVGSLGVISGSAAALAALNVGTNGNAQLAAGATIAHETFDTTLAAGNPAGLTNTPAYIFGIANDFAGPAPASIVVGSLSGSPWIGFGSDRSDRVFGETATTVAQSVLIAGNAQLVAHAQTLTLNAQLASATVNPVVTKRGKGTVILANTNNPFDGVIMVNQGALLVNGALPAVQTVVTAGGATLGGAGSIGGAVAIQAGGILSPGGNSPADQVGVLTVNALSLTSAKLAMTLDGPVNDRVVVNQNNALSLSGVSVFDLSELGNLSAGVYTLIDYAGNPLGSLANFALASPVLNGFNLELINNVGSTSVDVSVTPIVQAQWAVDSSGTWPTGANWLGGVPNGIEHAASFGNVITAPRTVTVSSPQTVGVINFDSPLGYTIAGAATLTLATGAGDAAINVLQGSHTISAPLSLNQHLTINSAAGAGVNITAAINAPSRIITKDGLGSVQFAAVRAQRLDVAAGSAKISLKGSANDPSGASSVAGLNIFSGAQLDLTNNALIVDYSGAAGTLVDDVRVHLQQGRLVSSAATSATRLGYGDNAILGKATFAGQVVDATSLLVKFTYAGDANLDGQVDVTDLAALATHWQSANPWTGGDFNYSGFVDVADLAMLASNWQAGVGAPLAMTFEQALASVGLGAVSIPEPAILGLVILTPLLATTRRRGR